MHNISIKSFFPIILISFLFVSGVFAFSIHEANHVTKKSVSWVETEKNYRRISFLADELESQLGYGGLIHNFKNFVLRGSPFYIEELQYNAREIENIMTDLKASNLDSEMMKQIHDIDAVLQKYVDNIPVAQKAVQTKQVPKEIDALVKVDDRPALQALKRFKNNINIKYQLIYTGINAEFEYIENGLRFQWPLNIVLAFLVYVFCVFLILTKPQERDHNDDD